MEAQKKKKKNAFIFNAVGSKRHFPLYFMPTDPFENHAAGLYYLWNNNKSHALSKQKKKKITSPDNQADNILKQSGSC